jgi:hypothetical protein
MAILQPRIGDKGHFLWDRRVHLQTHAIGILDEPVIAEQLNLRTDVTQSAILGGGIRQGTRSQNYDSKRGNEIRKHELLPYRVLPAVMRAGLQKQCN